MDTYTFSMVPKRTEENILGSSIVERNIRRKKNLNGVDTPVDLSDSRQSEQHHENRCQFLEAA